MKYLENFFNPDSVILIGASHHEGSVGNSIAKNLLLFKKVYFVNPNAEELFNKICYPSILDIHDDLRNALAVIAAKSSHVLKILGECAKKKIKHVIIISSGFSEIGNSGKILEKKVIMLAKKFHMKLIGPNCFGVINVSSNLNTTFSSIPILNGETALISQSGALGSGILDIAIQKKIGFSKLIFLGNEADIDFNDALEYFADDKKTKKILVYMEGLKAGTGRRFIKLSKKYSKKGKRIIAIKAGITEKGRKMILTHTAALAGESEIYNSAFEESGILAAKNLTDALKLIKNPLQKIRKTIKISGKSKRIIVISNAGGAAILLSDYFSQRNLSFLSLPSQLIGKLNKFLPETWNKANPVDIIGDAGASRYGEVLDLLMKENFDYLVCVLTPQSMSQPFEVAKKLVEFRNKSGKKVIACFIGEYSMKLPRKIFKKNKIPNFSELEECADFLASQK